jgi:hypothetical protein
MTATRIVWGEAMALTVARPLEEVQESLYEAFGNGGWILINAEDGQKVSVNPAQVLYLEEVEMPDEAQPPSVGRGLRRAHRGKLASLRSRAR